MIKKCILKTHHLSQNLTNKGSKATVLATLASGLRPSFPATPVVPAGRAFFNKVLKVRLRTQNFELSGLGHIKGPRF